MGAPNAFEHRRAELALLKAQAAAQSAAQAAAQAVAVEAIATAAAEVTAKAMVAGVPAKGPAVSEDSAKVSDDDVLGSFLGSVAWPDGFVVKFLRLAQLGVVLGDTVRERRLAWLLYFFFSLLVIFLHIDLLMHPASCAPSLLTFCSSFVSVFFVSLLPQVFVHGAVTDRGLLFVPSPGLLHRHHWLAPPPGADLDPATTPPHAWIAQLNR